jgi:hypothetical protein
VLLPLLDLMSAWLCSVLLPFLFPFFLTLLQLPTRSNSYSSQGICCSVSDMTVGRCLVYSFPSCVAHCCCLALLQPSNRTFSYGGTEVLLPMLDLANHDSACLHTHGTEHCNLY